MLVYHNIPIRKNMANETITMTKLKSLLLQLARGTSMNSIKESLRISKKTICKYKALALETGTPLSELSQLSELQLEEIFLPRANVPNPDKRKEALDSMLEDILQSRNKYTTVELLWEEYIKQNPEGYRYTQFKKYVNDELKRRNLSYHKIYHPGEELQIDFAGDPLYIKDPLTGESTKVVVLVCVMPYSMLGYAIALPNAGQEQLFHGLSKCLDYLKAAPKVAVSDNMKQWVDHNKDRYEPPFTEATTEWANHYNIRPDVCRVRHPKDKAPAESLVYQYYRYIYARIVNEVHPSYDSLNGRIWELVDEYNLKPYRGSTRWDIYHQEELPLMTELPLKHFQFLYEKVVTLRSDYHVIVGTERNRYSVPYKYVNQEVKVKWNLETVEVFVNLERVAVHDRHLDPNRPSTKQEHMPERHKAYERIRGTNAASLLDRATFIGQSTRWAIETLLNAHRYPEYAYPACMGVLNLGTKYGQDRLEAACQVIQKNQGRVTYQIVSNMLKNSRDKLLETSGQITSTIPSNPNIRGASAYAPVNIS